MNPARPESYFAVSPIQHPPGQATEWMAESTGWITEWAKDPEPIRGAVGQGLSLPSVLVNLIVQYLRKSDLFGLRELEAGFGKEELERHLGKIGPEPQLPENIDEILQTDLALLFNNKAALREVGMTTEDLRKVFGTKKKVTEVFSLYFKPGNVSPNIMAELGIDHNAINWALSEFDQRYANYRASSSGWLLFSNQLLGFSSHYKFAHPDTLQRFLTRLLTQGYIKHYLDKPHIDEATFCAVTQFVCGKQRIWNGDVLERTIVQEGEWIGLGHVPLTVGAPIDHLRISNGDVLERTVSPIDLQNKETLRIRPHWPLFDPASNDPIPVGIAPVMRFWAPPDARAVDPSPAAVAALEHKAVPIVEDQRPHDVRGGRPGILINGEVQVLPAQEHRQAILDWDSEESNTDSDSDTEVQIPRGRPQQVLPAQEREPVIPVYLDPEEELFLGGHPIEAPGRLGPGVVGLHEPLAILQPRTRSFIEVVGSLAQTFVEWIRGCFRYFFGN